MRHCARSPARSRMPGPCVTPVGGQLLTPGVPGGQTTPRRWGGVGRGCARQPREEDVALVWPRAAGALPGAPLGQRHAPRASPRPPPGVPPCECGHSRQGRPSTVFRAMKRWTHVIRVVKTHRMHGTGSDPDASRSLWATVACRSPAASEAARPGVRMVEAGCLRGWGACEISVLPTQPCCEPKAALQIVH